MNILDKVVELTGWKGIPMPGGYPGEREAMLDVPLYQQLDSYSCGVMAATSVLQALGVKTTLKKVEARLKPSKVYGVSTRKIVDLLRKHGVVARVRSTVTLAEIRQSIDAGRPIIVTMRDKKDDKCDWHWVVIYGYGKSKVAAGVHMRLMNHWWDWPTFKAMMRGYGSAGSSAIICGG